MLSDLANIDINPDLTNIYGKLDGADLSIQNECHKAKGFRKIHLELANLGDGLHILHCVFFPDPLYEIPIFGVDIIARGSFLTAAIVDISPVSENLPDFIQNKLEEISFPNFSQIRSLPSWGEIFSPYVHFIRPENKQEEIIFFNIVNSYLTILLEYIALTSAEDSQSISSLVRYKYQYRYCTQQKLNDKTRNVLSKAFNEEWADIYIETLLFDFPDPL